MVWLSAPPTPTDRGNQRRTFRQSIELPIAVTVRGLSAIVYGTLIDISENGCRLRSLVLLDRNRIVEFTLNRSGHPPLELQGRIVARLTPNSEVGFEYGVIFEDLDAKKQQALGAEIAELQRRAAAARVEAAHRDQESSTADGQRRRDVRTSVRFPAKFRPANRTASTAEVVDISPGGLRMYCDEPLPSGSELELRFTLPSEVLAVFPPPSERIEISPFGHRRVRMPDNRRPFEEMIVRGRILARFEPKAGRECYGVGFTHIDGYQREEIARFAHAEQLSRLRGRDRR